MFLINVLKVNYNFEKNMYRKFAKKVLKNVNMYKILTRVVPDGI